MKLAIVGAILLALGGVAITSGLLPAAQALEIADRVWPVLLFVVAVTVVADLAARAGVFDTIATWIARASRGSTVAVFLAVVVLAVLATAFLSLDTTAVLLTPVVIALARHNRLDPLPFAFATVWLANTASLFFPVSNLTNLLAAHRLGGVGPWEFVVLLGPSALVAVVATIMILLACHGRRLRGRFTIAPAPRIADRRLLTAASVVVTALIPLLVSGLAPWIPATGAALVLLAVYAWRAPRAVRFSAVPWQIVVFASGLFLVVGALSEVGLTGVTALLAGHGTTLPDLWRLAGAGMLGANLVNNLPAYLAFEATADSPVRLAALLIGVNAGPLISPWASLATLLWHQRAVAAGVVVPWRRFIALGLVAGPVVVGASVIPLALH